MISYERKKTEILATMADDDDSSDNINVTKRHKLLVYSDHIPMINHCKISLYAYHYHRFICIRNKFRFKQGIVSFT